MGWTYELLPLEGVTGPGAIPEAQGVMCAASLAGSSYYWHGLASLGGSSFVTPESMFAQLMLPKSVDEKEFISCVNSADEKKYEKRRKDATADGLHGIPYTILKKGKKEVVVNGNVSYESVVKEIDKLLK